MNTPLTTIDEDFWVFDIETKTDFETFRLAGFKNILDGAYSFHADLQEVQRVLDSFDVNTTVVTWNGARFDLPFFNQSNFKFKHIDAMQLAKILYHDERKFSLDHWGERLLGIKKIEFTEDDYNNSDLELLANYLKRDLDITAGVYQWLLCDGSRVDLLNGDTDKVLQLEDKVARIVSEQVDNRVWFDVPTAEKLHQDIAHDHRELEKKLTDLLPVVRIPEHKIKHPPKKQFKKDGTPTAAVTKYLIDSGYTAPVSTGSSWTSLILPSLVSRPSSLYSVSLPLTEPLITHQQLEPKDLGEIKTYLLSMGWFPTEWNFSTKDGKRKRTSPRLTLKGSGEPCPNLIAMGVSWVEDLSKYLQMKNRLSVLHSDKGTGWIPTAKDNQQSLASDADTLGANTGRFTHKVIANVPRVGSYKGEEIRSLFCARPGKVWVGWDASALEARVEAHYCYMLDPSYASELCEGDVHARNLKLIPGLGTRDQAKTFKYAVTYGARPEKLAKTFGWDSATAQHIYDEFWNSNTALRKLKLQLEMHWKARSSDHIKGLDGRPIITRSEHSLLNALFQSAGAIIMKYAMVIADKKIRKEFDKNEAYGLIRYHDEEIWECLPEHAERVAEIGAASVVAAGKYLGLNVPLAAEAKIGLNWAEVH